MYKMIRERAPDAKFDLITGVPAAAVALATVSCLLLFLPFCRLSPTTLSPHFFVATIESCHPAKHSDDSDTQSG